MEMITTTFIAKTTVHGLLHTLMSHGINRMNYGPYKVLAILIPTHMLAKAPNMLCMHNVLRMDSMLLLTQA